MTLTTYNDANNVYSCQQLSRGTVVNQIVSGNFVYAEITGKLAKCHRSVDDDDDDSV